MAEARSVVVRLTAETAQYIAQMQASGRMTATAMTTAQAATMRQSQAVDNLGGKAGKLGLVAGAALGGMAKAAMDWESQWAGVSKTVNGTSEQLQQLEGDLRELARTMPASHQEIAATAEAAGQLGVATDDITDFTKIMVEMGTATNLSAEQASTSIAQFMNVMQTVPADVDEIGNTIVALGNKGASTESQITDMAQRVAGAGQLIGASEADVLGLSAAMANLGIQSELGGGAVQRSLTIINTAVKDGSDSLEGFAQLAGMTAEQFATQWTTDPVRAFDAIVRGMGRIQDSGGNVVSTLADMGIKGTQNLQVLLRLAGSGDMLSRSLDQSAEAWDQNNALQQEYAKRAETTASQVQVAWNQIKDAAIEGGAAILPVVADIASTVGTIAGAFGDLPDPIHDVVAAMLGITAITGGGLWLGAKVIGGITSTKASLAALRPEISRVGSDLVAKSGVRQFTSDLGIMAATSRTAGATTARELERTAAAGARVRSALGSAALRGGGLLAGITLASTGAADGMGLTNTMSLALMGTIAGPWGAAIGGGIGLVKDFRDSSKQAGNAIDEFNNSLDGTDFARVAAAFTALQDKTQGLSDDLHDVSGVGDLIGDSMGGWTDTFGQGLTDLSKASDESIDKLTNLDAVLNGVAQANGDFIASATNDRMQNLPYGDLEDMARVAAKVQPVLEDLGYSLDDLMALKPGSDEAARAIREINDALEFQDSDAGRIDAIGQALDGLGGELETTADKADALSDSLDALLDPNMSLSEATDEWTTALRHLNDDLAKNNKTLRGNSDAAIKNRGAVRDRVGQFKDLLVAEANAGASSGKLTRMLGSQRKALIDAGAAAGISREDMRAYLKVLGLTPKLVKTVIQADTDKASHAITSLGDQLSRLDGTTATTYIDTIQRQWSVKQHNASVSADGSTVPKTGMAYADRHPYLLADGEEVISNRHGQADRHRPLLKAINANRLADGGTAGWFPGLADGGTARSLDSRLEIAQIMQQIRDLTRDLKSNKKGDRLTGLDRKIAQLQLEAAERDLRRAKHADEREAAQAAREKAKEQRQTRADLTNSMGTMFDSLLPQEEQTVAQGVASTIADFREQWLAAGGVWSKELREWAQDTRVAAKQYDRVTTALEAEQKKRDELTATLDEQKSQLETLNSTMSSYNDTVAGNFLNNPFNGAHTVTEAGAAGPATAALDAAVAELAALRASATGDNVAEAARASQLLAQIASLKDAAAAEIADTEVQISGLQALRTTLETDTANADKMTAALAMLAQKGLDTSGDLGGLYQQLAASGDFATAEELSQLSAEQIDEYEKLFKAREDSAATLAAQATQAVYADQQAALQAQIDQQSQLIAAVDATMTLLNATQVVLGEQVRAGSEAGAHLITPKLTAINQSIQDLARQQAEQKKKARV